jgi:hypothetical protein
MDTSKQNLNQTILKNSLWTWRVGCVTDDFSFTSATTTKNFTEEEDYDYMKVG